VLRWAGYLASSWTWVIGMLWPALLVWDFGLWGWLAFAVPNVIGAGAFGFVLARPEVSRRVVDKHAYLAGRFSEVTIAFQVFAGGWVLWVLAGPEGVLAALAVALLTAMVGYSRSAAVSWLGLGAWVISLGLGVAWLAGAWPAVETYWAGLMQSGRSQDVPWALIWLAPAIAVGFLLCPYLDMTFHRARQATSPATGKAAFGLGFGVCFLLMIGFSLVYAVPMGLVFASNAWPSTGAVPGWGVWVLAGHIALQAGVTTGFHFQEVAQRHGHAGLHRTLALAVAGGALAYWAIDWVDPADPPALWGQSPGQLVYQCFMLFYGLVFPAYVWLVMLPTRRAVAMPGKIAVWLVAVLVALPGAFFGFIGDRAWLVGLVLAVLVIARLCLALLPAAGKDD
jgi:hypothetical protein